LKRYFIFAYDQYYPKGGIADFWDDTDTEDAAFEVAAKAQAIKRHVQIYDTEVDKYVLHPKEWESWGRVPSAERLGAYNPIFDTGEDEDEE